MDRLAVQRAAAIDLCLEAPVKVLTVCTDSMAPGIPVGARVRVERCGPGDIASGDVILLRCGGQLCLHRYLGPWTWRGRRYLICKGDRRRRPDLPWPVAALAGRAVSMENGGQSPNPSGARLRARLYCLAARFGLAVGLLARPRPSGGDSCRVAIMGRIWNVEISGDSAAARQALAAALVTVAESPRPDDSANISFGRQPEGGLTDDNPASLRVRLGSPLPDALPGQRFTAAGLETAAAGIVVRLKGLGGEVFARTQDQAVAGLEAFFRLTAERLAAEQGGLCLHAAAAVSASDSLYVFAGPSNAGKTTAARAFGAGREVDEDFVLLLPTARGFVRAPVLPLWRFHRAPSLSLRQHPVRAVLLPGKGSFSLERLEGAVAVAACLHLPPRLSGVREAEAWLAAAARLAERVPVFKLRWRKGEDLPRLLAAALAAPAPSSDGDR